MRMKKRTIFSLFVVPLILVMMVQAMISYGTFFFSGTPFLLKEYSVGILNQTVENRKILLENDMVQRWSEMKEEEAKAKNALEQQLTTRRITVHDFLNNEEAQKDFLENMLDTMLYMMRKNTVTGSFLILANDSVGTQESTCDGISGIPILREIRLIMRMSCWKEGQAAFPMQRVFPWIRFGPPASIWVKAGN